MRKDKLAIVVKVVELRSQKQRAAWQASTAAVLAKRADISQLQNIQNDYQDQIAGWQSGLPTALRDRFIMYGNLTNMLVHLGDELLQLEAMERRCAAVLLASQQQIEGLKKLQEQRAKAEQQKIRRSERRVQ